MKKLHEFDFPTELKNMSVKDTELLATAIREFLIDKVPEKKSCTAPANIVPKTIHR